MNLKSIHLSFTRTVEVPKALAGALCISAFTLMTALAAFVRVPLPFTPVPMTLQTLAVLLSAGFLGKRAVLSQAFYVTLGACGLPIYSGAAFGVSHLLGPTGGYLAGFVVAAFAAGRLMEDEDGSLISISLSMLAAALTILLLGTAWLACLLRIDIIRAAGLGLLPFILPELVKTGLATVIVWGWRRTINRKGVSRC